MTEHPPEPFIEPARPRPRPPPAPRSGWRKAARVVGIAVLSLLGLILLAVVGGIVWLHTGRGAATVGRFVTSEARNAIQGDLRVRAVQVGGFLHVCVDGVELRDPEGHPALRAERACVKLQPLPLKAHKIIVTEAELVKPWIEIAKVPALPETTLQRAIKPRKPPQPGKDHSQA